MPHFLMIYRIYLAPTLGEFKEAGPNPAIVILSYTLYPNILKMATNDDLAAVQLPEV